MKIYFILVFFFLSFTTLTSTTLKSPKILKHNSKTILHNYKNKFEYSDIDIQKAFSYYDDTLSKQSKYFRNKDVQKQFDYFKKHYSLAKELELIYNIPIYLTFAQALHESGCGTSPVAVHANNHFGVKGWNKEPVRGRYRKYKSVEECYHYRAVFFQKYYKKICDMDITDYKKVCGLLRGYGSSGYDIAIYNIVKKYQLYKIK
jgi:uncharacterized FlgJ-related protein